MASSTVGGKGGGRGAGGAGGDVGGVRHEQLLYDGLERLQMQARVRTSTVAQVNVTRFLSPKYSMWLRRSASVRLSRQLFLGIEYGECTLKISWIVKRVGFSMITPPLACVSSSECPGAAAPLHSHSSIVIHPAASHVVRPR